MFELHPVLAYDLGGGWSVGGGVRYVLGNLDQDDNVLVSRALHGTAPVPVEVERNASADVDDLAWDLAVHYTAPSWGWGAVYRSPERLKGNGDVNYTPRDVPAGLPPALDAAIRATSTATAAPGSRSSCRARSGPGSGTPPIPSCGSSSTPPGSGWSSLESTDVTYDPDRVGDGPTVQHPARLEGHHQPAARGRREHHRQLPPLRRRGLGALARAGRHRRARLPAGDALVYAVGFSYSFPQLSFDVGYSFHDHDDRGAADQELDNPSRTGTYKANDRSGASPCAGGGRPHLQPGPGRERRDPAAPGGHRQRLRDPAPSRTIGLVFHDRCARVEDAAELAGFLAGLSGRPE